MKKVKLQIVVEVPNDVDSNTVRKLTNALILVGLADAEQTAKEGEGNTLDAELVLGFNYMSPQVV